MESIQIAAGCATIVAVVYFLIKQYETRLVLLSAGLFMCVLAGQPMAGFSAFATNMTVAGLIQTILSVMGFAAVMNVTNCNMHLVNAMAGPLSKVRIIMIPATVLVTGFINASLPSAAGVAAAVGSVLIPLLISMGVHPAMAASAVMAGTFGSMMSPGLSHNPYIAQHLMKTDVMSVIAVHWKADVACLCIGAIALAVVAAIRKENKGYVANADEHKVAKIEKPNLIYAALPILPVFLLVLSAIISGPQAPAWGKSLLAACPFLKSLGVPPAMLIGAILGIVVTRSSPTNCVKEFFSGMGSAYAVAMGIIISAGVFVAGMKALGLVDFLITILKNSSSAAKIAAAAGPFFLAVIVGSGDAATLAFNQAVTPFAEHLGMTIPNMASLATLTGALGRTMSPLASAAIICAGIAKVSPMELSRRNTFGMIIALVASYFIFS